jgi:hypothetical protein
MKPRPKGGREKQEESDDDDDDEAVGMDVEMADPRQSAAAAAAGEGNAAEPAKKRNRNGQVEMLALIEAGSTHYTKCGQCGRAFLTRKKKEHNCHVTPTAAVASDEREGFSMRDIKQTSCNKQFLPSTLHEKELSGMVLSWMRGMASTQQQIYLVAAPLEQSNLMHEHNKKEVSIDTIHLHMSKRADQAIVCERNQDSIRRGLAVCCDSNQVQQTDDTICRHYENHFRHGLSTVVDMQPSSYHLADASLSTLARQMLTGFCNMMHKLIWSKTKMWVRCELTIIVAEVGDMFVDGPHAKLLLDAVKEWLHTYMTTDKNLELFATQVCGEEALRKHFFTYLQSRRKIAAGTFFTTLEQQQAWRELWDRMYARFIRPIHDTLMPFEWASATAYVEARQAPVAAAAGSSSAAAAAGSSSAAAAAGSSSAAAAAGSSSAASAAAPRIPKPKTHLTKERVASLRCTWLFAILLRLEQMQADLPEDAPPLVFKAYTLFPQPGWIPAHITFDNALLSHMPNDFHAHLRFLADREVYRRLVDEREYEEENEEKPSSSSARLLRKRKRPPDKLPSEPQPSPLDPDLHGWQQELQEAFDHHIESAPESDPYDIYEMLRARLPTTWKEYWNRPSTFWHDDRDPSDVRLRSAMVSDGVAVAFRMERLKKIEFRTDQKAPRPKGAIKTDEEKRKAKEYAISCKAALFYSDQLTVDWLDERKILGVLTIDANRKNFFVATFRFTHDLLLDPDQKKRPRDIIIRFSKAELKHVRGTKHATHVRQELASRAYGSPQAAAAAQAAPSLKTTDPARWTEWKAFMNQNFASNLKHYRTLTYRRLRMESYSAQQHFWSHVQDKIYSQLNRKLQLDTPLVPPRKRFLMDNTPRILIAMGDGSFRHNSKGHLTMPTGARMYKELEKLGEHMCWVDEHNSSKCCSACGEEMEQSVVRRKACLKRTSKKRQPLPPAPPDPPDPPPPPLLPFARRHRKRCSPSAICRHTKSPAPLPHTAIHPPFFPLQRHFYPLSTKQVETDVVELWGLRSCFSKQCRNRIWDRDVNACICMLHRIAWTLSYHYHGGGPGSPVGPAYLLRTSGP